MTLFDDTWLILVSVDERTNEQLGSLQGSYAEAKQLKIKLREDFYRLRLGADYMNENKRKSLPVWIKKLASG